MDMSRTITLKRYGLLSLAILSLMLGGVGVYFGSHNFPIRVLGLAAIMASTYLVRLSRAYNRSGLTHRGTTHKIAEGGPGRLLWIVSLALVPLLGAAFFLMHIDYLNGGHEAWPVDVFGGIGLVCALVWSYLAAKISISRRSR